MEFEKILKLIESVSKSSLSSFTLEEGNIKIVLEANRGNTLPVTVKTNTTEAEVSGYSEIAETADEIISDSKRVGTAGNVIKSPLVGVFYSAPSPDAEPFVKVGDKVSKGQTLGIVEAMKLMNEIECEYDGIVKEILIENGAVAEYGQSLFVIE